jgi:hypothetical protein
MYQNNFTADAIFEVKQVFSVLIRQNHQNHSFRHKNNEARYWNNFLDITFSVSIFGEILVTKNNFDDWLFLMQNMII